MGSSERRIHVNQESPKPRATWLTIFECTVSFNSREVGAVMWITTYHYRALNRSQSPLWLVRGSTIWLGINVLYSENRGSIGSSSNSPIYMSDWISSGPLHIKTHLQIIENEQWECQYLCFGRLLRSVGKLANQIVKQWSIFHFWCRGGHLRTKKV